MKQEFTAIIKQHEGINGAYIEIPFDVYEIYGAKRVKVVATFDDTEYRGSIVSMGGCYLIGMTQQIRKEINKNFGDSVFVTITKDEAERIVEMPQDFEELLKENETARDFYNSLSYSNQKKYVKWVADAKRAETRIARINKAIAMLEGGETI